MRNVVRNQQQTKKQKKETKSATWTYSQELKKLYVRMRSPCPIRFRTCSVPPHGCLIRAMPLYMKPEHIQEVVRRCPNHASKVDDLSYSSEHFAASSEHLLWCENKEAQYVEDAYTGRLSVVFPHEVPQAGTEWVTNLFQFACFSSCVGGLNRRPLQVVFTLEHGTEVLGRQAVEVRICACPGRDRRTEEKSELEDAAVQSGNKQSNLVKSGRNFSTSNKRHREGDQSRTGSKPGVELKRRQEHDDDVDSIYSIKVYGRQNYEMLKRIRDALELSDLIQPEQKSLVFQQMAGNEPSVSLESPSTFLTNTSHLHHHHGNYANSYVINDLNKMASVDQTLTENEVSSTGINLSLVDIQQILTPRAPSLSSLLQSNPYLQTSGTNNNNNRDDDDDDDGDDDDNIVDTGRNVTTSSWLESINMGMYSDQFHGRNLFGLNGLEKLALEDLQSMSIPIQHRDLIWKKLLELKSKDSLKKHPAETPRQMLAPITEFQQRPPPLPPLDNSTTIVTFTNDNKFQQHSQQQQHQQLIQLQQIIVNTHSLHSPSKIELLTPVYYKNNSSNSELLPLSEQDHNYCSET